jgi:hypothetical protein
MRGMVSGPGASPSGRVGASVCRHDGPLISPRRRDLPTDERAPFPAAATRQGHGRLRPPMTAQLSVTEHRGDLLQAGIWRSLKRGQPVVRGLAGVRSGRSRRTGRSPGGHAPRSDIDSFRRTERSVGLRTQGCRRCEEPLPHAPRMPSRSHCYRLHIPPWSNTPRAVLGVSPGRYEAVLGLTATQGDQRHGPARSPAWTRFTSR